MARCSSATASAITIDAGWYGFCFAGVGSSPTAGCQNSATAGVVSDPITFVAVGPVRFKITDAFNAVDQFNVAVDGGGAVASSAPAGGVPGISDPDLAFADARYSHYSVILAPGAHSIHVTMLQSPLATGGAYLEVESVPEPASVSAIDSPALAALVFASIVCVPGTVLTGASFAGVTVSAKLPAASPPAPSDTMKLKASLAVSLPSWA